MHVNIITFTVTNYFVQDKIKMPSPIVAIQKIVERVSLIFLKIYLFKKGKKSAKYMLQL